MIRTVHEEYVAAGANLLITASYQATLPGFAKARGVGNAEAAQLLQRSVQLAREAAHGRSDVLIAASVANYGAHLADGSEFTGSYAAAMSVEQLLDFLRPHATILHAASPDLLAFETMSSLKETRAVCALLRELPNPCEAYMSFTTPDGRCLPDGTPLSAVVAELEACSQVSAMGINCTAPNLISHLLAELPSSPRLLRLVYPNSGEIYDGATGGWHGQADALFCAEEAALRTAVQSWHTAGAHLVGGCCRTGPTHTRIIQSALAGAPSHPPLPTP